jgi:hypothetical protein
MVKKRKTVIKKSPVQIATVGVHITYKCKKSSICIFDRFQFMIGNHAVT